MQILKSIIYSFFISFLLYACTKDDYIDSDKFTKIDFESTSFEIAKGGGLALVSSTDSLWSIYGCYEIINGEKIYIKNEVNVINEKKHLKDTVYGDWYSLYKKQNIIAIVLSPNTGDTERTLWIECKGPLRFQETITIRQK